MSTSVLYFKSFAKRVSLLMLLFFLLSEKAYGVPSLVSLVPALGFFMIKIATIIASTSFVAMSVFKNKKRRAMLIGVVIILVGSAGLITLDFKREVDLANRINNAGTIREFKDDSHKVVGIDEIVEDFDNFYIVDVRENIEFKQGHFVGSQNHRVGDILNNKELREDISRSSAGRKLLFFCHDGERSKSAANNISEIDNREVYVVEKGFDQLKETEKNIKGVWLGPVSRVLPLGFWDEIKGRGAWIDEFKSGLIIDLTEEQVYKKMEVENDKVYNAILVNMDSEEFDVTIKSIGEREFEAICNTKLSCFYAKVLAYEVEKNGGKFLGYYFFEE